MQPWRLLLISFLNQRNSQKSLLTISWTVRIIKVGVWCFSGLLLKESTSNLKTSIKSHARSMNMVSYSSISKPFSQISQPQCLTTPTAHTEIEILSTVIAWVQQPVPNSETPCSTSSKESTSQPYFTSTRSASPNRAVTSSETSYNLIGLNSLSWNQWWMNS